MKYDNAVQSINMHRVYGNIYMLDFNVFHSRLLFMVAFPFVAQADILQNNHYVRRCISTHTLTHTHKYAYIHTKKYICMIKKEKEKKEKKNIYQPLEEQRQKYNDKTQRLGDTHSKIEGKI